MEGGSYGLSSGRVRTGFPSQLSSTMSDADRAPLKRSNSYIRSNVTSTWKAGTAAPEEYISEKNYHFTNPRQKMVNSQLQEQVMKFPYEQQREKQRDQAIEKFEKLAKKKYGSVEGLFAAFRKDHSSSLTLDELSEHLRKRNMDLYFPRDDQRLLFEKLDTTHSLKLPITQIIQHYSSAAPHVDLSHGSQVQQQDSQRERDQQKQQQDLEETDIKDLILSKIDDQRGSNKLAESPRQTKLQLVRALRNLDPNSTGNISVEQLTWALGPEYLDLGLSNQEVETTLKISKGVDLKNDHINYSRFISNLNIRNTEPICDPFFDRRANQITRLKQRLNGLNEFSSDPAILERRDELMKICMVGPGEDGIKRYLDPSRPTTLFRPLSPSPLLRNCASQPSLSSSAASVSDSTIYRNSPDSTLPPPGSSSGASSPIRYPEGSHSHHAINTSSSQLSDRNNSDSGRPAGGGQEQEQRTGIVDGKVVKTGHFRATSNAPSRTFVKYPMTVDVRRAHAEHKESLPGGKRHGPTQIYDGTLLHHNHTAATDASTSARRERQWQGQEPSQQQQQQQLLSLSQSLPNLTLSSSASFASAGFSSVSASPSASYLSTNDQYFTPLDYQPSKPVSRPGVISDAMRSALERETRRRKRYERTRANLQSFKDRAELEKISQALNDASRSKGRVLESLQYELTAFHADLQVHHRRPVETMQRKPNPQLFKKMWGGNLSSSSPNTKDDRDFSTTYDRSYLPPSTDSSSSAAMGSMSHKESFPLA